jgi:hypothetical protein
MDEIRCPYEQAVYEYLIERAEHHIDEDPDLSARDLQVDGRGVARYARILASEIRWLIANYEIDDDELVYSGGS